MNASELVSELGACIGFTNLALDANGVCGLDFDDSIHVDLERDSHDESSLFLHTVISVAPTDSPGLRFTQMLIGCHKVDEEEPTTLSLDPSTGEIVLWLRFSSEYKTAEALSSSLDGFVKSARAWQARLNQAHQGTALMPEFSELGSMIRV